MDKALLYCNFTMTVRFLIEYVYFEFIVLRRSKGLRWFVSFLVHLGEFPITSTIRTFETVYQLSLKSLTF